MGTASGLKKEEGNFLILDIGGGSTEFILGVGGRLDHVHSAPLGGVSFTEAFLLSDPTRSEEVERLSEAVRVGLQRVPLFQDQEKPIRLIGTAGTVTTLAAMVLGLDRFDRSKVHNSLLTRPSIEKILSLLLDRTLAERRKLPGLEAGREDVIVAGVVILLRVMELLRVTEVEVSDYGLLEGIVIHHARRLGLIPI
jgi:exopolyphosphatase/guanosine-5'-triphosphate,3'-diphosphate pyrophosphatase